MRRAAPLALLAVCVACSDIEQPSPPALHDVIVYEGPNQFGTPSAWTIKLDGSGRQQMVIVGASGVVGSPEVSPDGRQVVLEFADNLYIANVDGTGWHALIMDSPPDRDPTWSPDGSRIAFISQRDGNPELYVVDSNGTNATRLTSTLDLHEADPSWSPDGQWIVISSEVAADPADPAVAHLWKVPADGGQGAQKLTDGQFLDFHPDWSPVDGRIVFASSRGPGGTMYMTDASGAAPLAVSTGDEESLLFPSWSPDGSQLVFICGVGLRICRSLSDGTNRQFLTDGSFGALNPQWVP